MSMKGKLSGIVLFFVCVALVSSGRVHAADWRVKVAPDVLAAAVSGQETEFLVLLNDQADLQAVAKLTSKYSKGYFVVERLKSTAAQSQAPIIALLERRKIPYQSFWIINMLAARGDLEDIQMLVQWEDVEKIVANTAAKPIIPTPTAALNSVAGVEANIQQINADAVWTLGYTGQGVVVAGQDTGYQWDHSALKGQYRGWDGSAADHDYNWRDAIHAEDPSHPSPNPCGLDSPVPCDDHGHGTHTMGTMLGDDGGSNQTGVAPGAEWIACRNMESGYGRPSTYAECFQWFLAPTRVDGSDPNPAKAPHIINNSWACPTSEGCTDPQVLQQILANVRAAGIVVVVSAGNYGPACGSVMYPPAIYDGAFSIGAVDNSDMIAGFSSRGPVTVDGSGRFKPDVSGPGVGVRSSLPNDNYGSMSGTSMASPSVAGTLALLISADPALAGQVDMLEMILRNTAVPLTSTQTCGDLPGSQSPNHTFGYGRIDALAAVNYALNPPPAVAPQVQIGAADAYPTLFWTHDRANCQYAVYRSSQPYFSPSEAVHLETVWGDVTRFIDQEQPSPLGDSAHNVYYQVEGINCGGDTAVSNTAGEFDFSLAS